MFRKMCEQSTRCPTTTAAAGTAASNSRSSDELAKWHCCGCYFCCCDALMWCRLVVEDMCTRCAHAYRRLLAQRWYYGAAQGSRVLPRCCSCFAAGSGRCRHRTAAAATAAALYRRHNSLARRHRDKHSHCSPVAPEKMHNDVCPLASCARALMMCAQCESQADYS